MSPGPSWRLQLVDVMSRMGGSRAQDTQAPCRSLVKQGLVIRVVVVEAGEAAATTGNLTLGLRKLFNCVRRQFSAVPVFEIGGECLRFVSCVR